jgi:type I restriction enzyme, S subunit
MPSEWPQVTVAQIAAPSASALATGPFGSSISSKYFVESGVPVIRGANLSADVSCRLSDDGLAYVSKEKAREFQRSVARRGDLVFTCWGTINQVGLIDDAAKFDEYIVSNKQMKLTVDPDKADARFVYYVFSGPEKQQEILENGIGSSVPGFNLGQLRAHVLLLPPLSEQRAIAGSLKLLDDRIDLLRQTNATLESIAQALFKSWFIDFDPVRAKAEGREPEGMDAATAALFPAEFEESALGGIPTGWTVSTLAEHVAAERGLSYKGAGLREAGGGTPMHNLNSVLEGGGYKYAGIKHYAGDFKDRHTVSGGEIIVANTEQGHDHRLIGFPAIVPMRYERAIFSHHIYRVRLRPSSPLTVHTLYFMLMAPSVREQVIGCANGSTVNMLKLAGLEIPQFVCPSYTVAQAFESVARPLRQQAEANVERISVLTELRDALLPRLVSGKLRLTSVQEDSSREVELGVDA